MADLQSAGMDGIALAALEHNLFCDGVNGSDLWSLVGGWHGLRQMHANSHLLLALAAQAQAWDGHASVLALEQMGKTLSSMRRAVLLSLWDRVLSRGTELSCLHLHAAANSYYDMTELLLKLYRHSPSRLYTHLEAALWPRPYTAPGAV